jgi:hypothetical protein
MCGVPYSAVSTDHEEPAMRPHLRSSLVAAVAFATAATAAGAQNVFISSGGPDGRLGSASNPSSAGVIERETGDDFVLSQRTRLTAASFWGLLPAGLGTSGINAFTVEIYRVFPFDSDVGRTSGAPDFSTSQVPTRVNSPSDVALDSRDLGSGLSLNSQLLGAFSVQNTVVNGINPKPNQNTGGEGPASGDQVLLQASFTEPFDLAAGHYFVVPQVGLTNGTFLWLSAARPIVGGTPFMPDLQSWMRDENLDPDWLRLGTDIVGNTTFNASFTLTGTAVPEPGTLGLCGSGLLALIMTGYRRRRRA